MIFQHVTRKHIKTHAEHSFFCPRDDSEGGIKNCPYLSVCLSVCPSVRHTLRNRVCVLLKFSVDLFETLRTCCGHNEDMYMDF